MSDILALWRDALPGLLGGLGIGVSITGLCLLFGLPLGLCIALGTVGRRPWIRLPCLAIATVGRGAPVLILLEGVAAASSAPGAVSGPFGATLTPFGAAVLALSWWAAARASLILRGALDAVPRGQAEAAGAIGLGERDTLRFVVLPQVLRAALPALLALSVSLLQATALGFSIGLPDLLGRTLAAGAEPSRVMPLLVLAGLLYAAVSLPPMLLGAALARRGRRPVA